jgi:hypothetical protein
MYFNYLQVDKNSKFGDFLTSLKEKCQKFSINLFAKIDQYIFLDTALL